MVKSTDNGSLSIPPFLKKCYDMVDDKSTDTIISWSQNNDSFVISDTTEFSVQLLPKYFKHSNFSSFIRQLNIYGFRKIDADRWEFANDGFMRGQKHLLKNICRRKHSQGPDQRISAQQQEKSVEPCEKDEKIANAGLWKEIESLKIDKNALMQELVKLRQLNETTDNKLLLLGDRLQGMEKNQQQMLSFLVMAMQNPGILVQLHHPKENTWRIAEASSIVEEGTEDAEPITSDAMIVKYQPPIDETPNHVPTPMTGSEKPQESNPSSDGMKDILMNIDFTKLLMDENHVPFPFIPPDLPDDGAWEQLLLDGAFSQNIEDAKQDGEGPVDSGMEMATASGAQLETSQNFELLLEQMDKSHDFGIQSTGHVAHLENSPNLETLTAQMGLLASLTNHKHGTQ